MPRKRSPFTAQQELFVRMAARAESRKDIMREVFGIDIDTAPQNIIHNADCKMSRWRDLPEYEATWKDEVKKILYATTGKAIRTITGQMEDTDQPWLQNKAANDILNYGKSHIFGDESRTVHVTIEGLPDLGTPDDE